MVNLPNEIINLIFSYKQNHESTKLMCKIINDYKINIYYNTFYDYYFNTYFYKKRVRIYNYSLSKKYFIRNYRLKSQYNNLKILLNRFIRCNGYSIPISYFNKIVLSINNIDYIIQINKYNDNLINNIIENYKNKIINDINMRTPYFIKKFNLLYYNTGLY